MKKLIKEVGNEGMVKLIGKNVALFCVNYIYAGQLMGVSDNEDCVLLTNAKIVYETGPLHEAGFKDAQDLPSDWYVQTASIESFGEMS